ncbi:hypothetical protein OS493_036514 [Desmophyllum pertusum]|uniref:Uncharacterized protein n=1 Tax=Desmophyllum pertusum TaxID=174260 RepID=A0A9W9ZWC0_9CNID|nr:hypothetical protein OS493_036514 [Desmophyllum pertusum]
MQVYRNERNEERIGREEKVRIKTSRNERWRKNSKLLSKRLHIKKRLKVSRLHLNMDY